MKIAELLHHLAQHNMQEELTATFDFPLMPGMHNKFTITGVSKSGSIILKNETIQRPLGHE